MANETMTLISTVTVGSGGAASIDFTSIPSTYTDLQIVLSAASSYVSANMDGVGIRFNGSTSSYSGKRLIGTGTSVYSDSVAANSSSVGLILTSIIPTTTITNTFGISTIYIPNYSGSANKTVSGDGLGENNGTFAEGGIHAGLWSNTSAVTSISLVTYYASASFVQYSTASLYGILKGSGGATVS